MGIDLCDFEEDRHVRGGGAADVNPVGHAFKSLPGSNCRRYGIYAGTDVNWERDLGRWILLSGVRAE